MNREETVFVLGGGGNLGAVQVGMMYTLLEAGIVPDSLVGTSVGALNAAYLAGHTELSGVENLANLWASIGRRDVFPVKVRGLAGALLGHRASLFESLGLRSLIMRAQLGYSKLENAPLPIYVVATDIQRAETVVLDHGSVVEALLASSAIPGIFPPVEVKGRLLVDGGVLANVPILQADALGAKTIYVLPTLPENFTDSRSNALVAMQRAVAMASQPVWQLARETVASHAEVHILPVPPRAAELSMFDFSSSEELIDSAYDLCSSWLGSLEAPRQTDNELVVA